MHLTHRTPRSLRRGGRRARRAGAPLASRHERRPVDPPTAPPSSGSAATCACATSRCSSPPRRPRGAVLALFVLDPALLGPSGAPRRTFLYRCLRALDESARRAAARRPRRPGRRRARSRRPRSTRRRCTSPPTSARTGAPATRPSRRRSPATGRELVRTGSPYAVAPGRVTKPDGTPYRVFTPFSRAWAAHGWRAPADTDAGTVDWIDPADKHGGPRPGADPRRRGRGRRRAAARRRGRRARARGEAFVDERRRRLRATSGPSRQARHVPDVGVPQVRRRPPADPAGRPGRPAPARAPTSYRTELCLARLLRRRALALAPSRRARTSTRRSTRMPWDSGADADEQFARLGGGPHRLPDRRRRRCASCAARRGCTTGCAWSSRLPGQGPAPAVVVGRAALHATCSSTATSPRTSTAGSGWPARAPTPRRFFRVFNPVTQGERFDPHGDYVRRFVPELRDVAGKAVHRPWELPSRPSELPGPDRRPRRAPGGPGPLQRPLSCRRGPSVAISRRRR